MLLAPACRREHRETGKKRHRPETCGDASGFPDVASVKRRIRGKGLNRTAEDFQFHTLSPADLLECVVSSGFPGLPTNLTVAHDMRQCDPVQNEEIVI
jgi:hypothetical protein